MHITAWRRPTQSHKKQEGVNLIIYVRDMAFYNKLALMGPNTIFQTADRLLNFENVINY
jgi:hypothetical protein